MPKDEWENLRRRDHARKALRLRQFDRAPKRTKPKKKPRKAKVRKAICLDTFKDRPPIITLNPPYPKQHPVPTDYKT